MRRATGAIDVFSNDLALRGAGLSSAGDVTMGCSSLPADSAAGAWPAWPGGGLRRDSAGNDFLER
jgi:hypothetical protein